MAAFAIPAGVAALTFLAFLPTFQNGFVDWDDDHSLLNNPSYRGLGWTQLAWMFTSFHLGHYIPLTWITFGVDYLLWGLDPFGYHLTNLLLHTANAIVVYLVARRLLIAALPLESSRPLALRLSAALAALLFSIHPLRVESVAWATERKDVLFGLFYLLAVLVYLRRQDAGAEPAVRRRRYWICLLFFAGGLLSKVMAVTLPAVLLLLDAYPLRRFPLTLAGLRSSEARRALVEKLPFFALGALASVVAFRAVVDNEFLTPEASLRWTDRVAITVFGLGFYLWKSVFPVGLTGLYSLRFPFDPFTLPVVVSGIGLAGLLLLSAWQWRRRPALLIAFTIYAVSVFPVIGIFHNGLQIAADRYTYLATLPWVVLVGAAVLTGGGATRLLPHPRLRLGLLVVAPCLLVLTLGLLTWRQVQVWHDTESLWTHAVRYAPSGRVHSLLGRELVRRGKVLEALPHLRAATELAPDIAWKHYAAWMHYDLGVAFERLGRLPEATDEYARAVREYPTDSDLRNYLGVGLMKQGRFEEAVAELRHAVSLKADSPEARKNLGVALSRQRHYADAVAEFEAALRLSPDLAEAHEGLGLALMAMGDFPRAIREFRAALNQSRDPAEVRNNLGVALARQGDAEAAAREFRLAVELRPDFPAARRNLEAALQDEERRRRGNVR